MEFNINNLIRENIKKMIPYSSARHEFTGVATVYLDANENAFGSPIDQQYNRYPDPLQHTLKTKLSSIKGVPAQNIFLGNGSDEAIDLLFRIFCNPGKDNIIIFPPTYGMYKVCAGINDIIVKEIALNAAFQIDLDSTARAIDPTTKIIFICSPNNPTGNTINRNDIELLLNNFDGLVVVDEAYINYSRQRSLIPELTEYPNLVILQTLSKAWGLAGLRLGMAFAGKPIIELMNKVKYPYNINSATQQLATTSLDNFKTVNEWIRLTIEERSFLKEELEKLPFTQIAYPSDANFILVKMKEAHKIYSFLNRKGIIVRDRSRVLLCEDCLRITVGTPAENKQLLDALKKYNA